MKPLAFALLLVVLVGRAEAQDTARERAKRALAKAGGAAGRTSQRLAGFAAGIVLSEAAHAALAGDGDAVRDALESPTGPEFLIGLLTFGGTAHLSNTILGRLPGVREKLGTAVKGHLALASAMALTGAVEIDLNGASYGDLIRLDKEALEGAGINFHGVEFDRLALSLAIYAGAVPLWTRVQGVGRVFGRAVAQRLGVTAALHTGLALFPAPGGRLAAAGSVLFNIANVAWNMVGMMAIARPVDLLAQDGYSDLTLATRQWLGRRALRQAIAEGDVEATATALRRWRELGAEERNLAYAPVAKTDFELLRRLRRRGVAREPLDVLAEEAYGDFGGGLALLAQTLLIREGFGEGEHAGLSRRAAARQKASLRQAAREREASYARQLKILRDAEANSPELEALLALTTAELESERTAEGYLLEELGVTIPQPPTAPTTQKTPGPHHGGLTGALAR